MGSLEQGSAAGRATLVTLMFTFLQAMFGDHESYDGEGGDDEWSPTAATPTKATEF